MQLFMEILTRTRYAIVVVTNSNNYLRLKEKHNVQLVGKKCFIVPLPAKTACAWRRTPSSPVVAQWALFTHSLHNVLL